MGHVATLFGGHLYVGPGPLRNPPYPNTEPGCLHRWPYSARLRAQGLCSPLVSSHLSRGIRVGKRGDPMWWIILIIVAVLIVAAIIITGGRRAREKQLD